MKTSQARSQPKSVHSSTPLLGKNETNHFFSSSEKQKEHPFFGPAAIQPKPKIGQPNDKYEQEADAVADAVMQMPELPVQRQPMEEEEELRMRREVPVIQRACEECEQKEILQTKTSTNEINNSYTASNIAEQLNKIKNGGSHLSQKIQLEMNNKIGADFNDVRVHTGSVAIRMNRELGAKAFTFGRNIYFNQNQYNPESTDGKHLLVHELTHTIQQSGMGHKKIQRTLGDGHDLLAERFQGRLDLEAAYDNERVIKKGSDGPDVVILQLALIEAGHPLPNFGADGDFGSETQGSVMDFQRDNGLQVDGIVGPRTMEVLDALFTVGPVITPVCNNPGLARTLELQPVFFKCRANDPDPTGVNYFTQLTKANEIWSKLGVTFTTNSPVILNDCTNKTKGTTEAEQNAIGNLRSGAGIEVYYVDNNLASAGGGSTLSAGNASNVVLSDFGTSETLLAHELGHVLGLGHPPSNAEAGTIMQPSGSHSVANPERNTIGNLAFIVFPAGTDPICLTPDL